MASSDKKKKPGRTNREKAASQQDDDVIGKAYDGRLMRRLLTYLYPYKWAAFISIGAILIKATCDVLGPYLTEVAIDRYMTAHPTPRTAFLARWLSADPFRGIAQIALIYLGSLLLRLCAGVYPDLPDAVDRAEAHVRSEARHLRAHAADACGIL